MKERTGHFRSEILRMEVDWEATWAEQADRFNVLGSKACSVCYGGKGICPPLDLQFGTSGRPESN